MDAINRETRQSIHFSVGYIVAIEWPFDAIKRLDFQRALAENQLDFPQTAVGPHDFSLVRAEPSPLQVKVASLGPGVSRISVSSEGLAPILDLFTKEAEIICNTYKRIFLHQQDVCQVIQSNAKIRHLYSSPEHAFQYLWEERLGQSPQDFHYLGKRPVLGGGLRLFMPPIPEPEPVQIEVKIESFLRESQKMFIETFFVWPKPCLWPRDKRLDPEMRLTKVEKYAINEVWNFLIKPEIEEQK
jgi:hypothetical protein